MNKLPYIVDTHLHLWDRDYFKVSWSKGASHFNREFTLNDYLQDVKELMVKALFMEVNSDADSKKDELGYVLNLIDNNSNPLVGGIMYANPIGDDFEEFLNIYSKSNQVKGVRSVLHLPEYSKGLCLQDSFITGMHKLGEHQLTFDICLRAEELDDAITLAKACPDTNFILDHAGCINPPFHLAFPEGETWERWQSNMEQIGKQNNVYCKLSGLVSQLSKDWKTEDLLPVLKICLSSFPINRIIIGSDWPICTLTSTATKWFEALATILNKEGISIADQERIFSKNTMSLYNIEE